ncbi:DUF5994 family protein [Dactylosporangium sp. NPDC000521]|uniref:DUF5994 family protein n=1 Tax=Dactylosporangium sp. NPDC000521 TaxID=3363975 RepID=UPI003678D495
MLTKAQRATITPSGPPSSPRLRLAPTRAASAVLDGGWWPRSWDPVAELPGLVAALDARYGPIRLLMLNSDTWDVRFRRLAMPTHVVRTGWFANVDPGIVVATTERGDQIDLLVVPPDTLTALAEAAMTAAADPSNHLHPAEILNDPPATPQPRRTGAEEAPAS